MSGTSKRITYTFLEGDNPHCYTYLFEFKPFLHTPVSS